jgi:putative transposase
VALQRQIKSLIQEYYKDLITIENRNIVEGRIEAISKRAFYSRIQKLNPYDVMVARYGKQRADREFRVVGTHVRPTRILERVEIDHTPLDLILLDDELLIPLGRPYLTALIDSFSGCVVGIYIGYKEPSYDSVRRALLNAMLSKDYIKDLYPSIKKEWPCEGKIETLVVDNGAELWSTSLEYACKSIVIDIQYNPVAKPWLKPMVERFFGSLSQKLIVSMPGKTFSGIGKLDGYDPQKDAVMRFSVFMEVFHKWIVDVYNFEPDSRETNIPVLSWKIGMSEFPPVFYRDESIERLTLDLGLTISRSVRKDGVTFKGLRYDSHELLNYRKQSPPTKTKKQEVLIKINPSDLKYIYILKGDDSYLKVPCVEDEAYVDGLTLFQHETFRRLSRNFIRSQVDSESLAEARMEIESRIEQEVENISKLGRRKPRSLKGAKAVARHRDIGSDTISNTSIANQELRSTRPPAPPKSPENTDSHSKILEKWDDLADDLDAY